MSMPAGKYYIGDLCYVMTDAEWEEFLTLTIAGDRCLDGEFTFKDGRRFATYGTYWGDGRYNDQFSNSYGVDAGLIGCFKVEDIRHPDFDVNNPPGAVFDFLTEFGTREVDGVIYFGHVRIDTDETEGDEEWPDGDEEAWA